MATTRNSSIELLRIICITIIIMMHIITHNNCCDGVWGNILTAVGNCGVTTFILISGYYGISFNPKKIFHLRNIASFYLLIALLFEIYTHRPVSGSNIFSVFFPIISGKYWFLTGYALLVIFSPYINSLLDSLSRNTLRILVLLLIFVFYFIPTFFKYDIPGNGGKNIICMTAVYVLGRYIAQTKIPEKTRNLPLIITFIVTISIIILLDYLQQITGIKDYLLASHLIFQFDGDNSIFILIASSSLFLFFSRTHSHNKVINQLAKSVFAAYIMEWFVRPFLLQYIDIPNMSISIQPLATITFAILVYLLCTAIDQLRLLTTYRLENGFEAFECHLFNKAKALTEKILQRCP